MAFGKLVNLFALSSLAVIVCSYGATPANALSVEHDAMMHKRSHGHDAVAKKHRSRKHKKRQDGSSSTCRTRSSSASATGSIANNDATGSWTGSGSDSAATPTTASSTVLSESGSASSTSSQAAATTSAASSSGSGKLGLAWANGDSGTISNFYQAGRTNYIYTWGPDCPSEATSLGMTCMPMLWGASSDKTSAFSAAVTQGAATIAMGFNEVNEAGQANLGVADAITAWRQYLAPLKNEGYQLVAPVTSSNPNGITWMDQFIADCSDCEFDYIAVHFYGTDAQDMIDYIGQWSNYGKPIMVTEFACENYDTANENDGQQCSEDQVWAFYKTIIEWMESNSTVVSYFPFGIMSDMQGVNTLDQLMATSGSGTSLWDAILNLSF